MTGMLAGKATAKTMAVCLTVLAALTGLPALGSTGLRVGGIQHLTLRSSSRSGGSCMSPWHRISIRGGGDVGEKGSARMFDPSAQVGVGIGIKKNKNGEHVIVKLAKGYPAERSGHVKEGDIIIDINGTPADELDTKELMRELKGLPGSCLSLLVQRGGTIESIELERTLPPDVHQPVPAPDEVPVCAPAEAAAQGGDAASKGGSADTAVAGEQGKAAKREAAQSVQGQDAGSPSAKKTPTKSTAERDQEQKPEERSGPVAGIEEEMGGPEAKSVVRTGSPERKEKVAMSPVQKTPLNASSNEPAKLGGSPGKKKNPEAYKDARAGAATGASGKQEASGKQATVRTATTGSPEGKKKKETHHGAVKGSEGPDMTPEEKGAPEGAAAANAAVPAARAEAAVSAPQGEAEAAQEIAVAAAHQVPETTAAARAGGEEDAAQQRKVTSGSSTVKRRAAHSGETRAPAEPKVTADSQRSGSVDTREQRGQRGDQDSIIQMLEKAEREKVAPSHADIGSSAHHTGKDLSADVGLELEKNVHGDFMVTEVAEGGAAHLCGKVSEGDILTMVGGELVEKMSLQELKELLKGAPQTTVKLSFSRWTPGPRGSEGSWSERTLILTRKQRKTKLPLKATMTQAKPFRVSKEGLAALEAMGFDRADATRALYATLNRVEDAVDWLATQLPSIPEDSPYKDMDVPDASEMNLADVGQLEEAGVPTLLSAHSNPVEDLMALGFTRAQVEKALRRTQGRVMLAADILLEKGARKEKRAKDKERRERMGLTGLTGMFKSLWSGKRHETIT